MATSLWDSVKAGIEKANVPVAVIAGLIAIGTFAFSTASYMIDSRVNLIVKDPDFIAKIARRVRPSIVFDSNGVILVDTGALELLERPPEVTPSQKGTWPPVTKIIVHPKEFLSAEPIIEALDAGNVSVTTKRSTGLSWEITVNLRDVLISAGDVKLPEPSPPRFRLELIPR